MFHTSIQVKFCVAGLHCWPKAPDQVKFLSCFHRHLFTIRAIVPLKESRQLEFFILQKRYKRLLEEIYDRSYDLINFDTDSCEDIASKLIQRIPEAYIISVSEDEENAAIVSRSN